jgi:hypothetical protein
MTVVGSLSIVAAELAARIDDRVERGIPLLATPSYESELLIRKDGMWQGRPHGRYKKWQLNAFGFRSPEITLAKRPGCPRVMILGASEMFGLYESRGRDFAAALLAQLNSQRCYEVINAAMPGLGLTSARSYWDVKLAAFRPDVVLLYPTPSWNFEDPAAAHRPAAAERKPENQPQAAQAAPVRFKSRLIDRLREFVHTPAVIDDWRIRRAVAATVRAHPAGWVQQEPPAADLAAFQTQLLALVTDIQASGTRLILMTHARRTTPGTLAQHPHEALWMSSGAPYITPAAQLAFEALANDYIRTLASTRRIPLLDLDRLLTGCLECFADGAHFTDQGAARAAAAATTMIQGSQLGTVAGSASRGSPR